MRILALAALAFALSTTLAAHAGTTYYVTSAPINSIAGGGDFALGDRIEGYVTLSTPLGPNLNGTNPPLTAFSLTLGDFTLASSQSDIYSPPVFDFDTNGSGAITFAYIYVANASRSLYFYDDGSFDVQAPDTYGTEDGPDVWSTTPPVPEPSSIVLLGTGILSLAGAARRRFLKAWKPSAQPASTQSTGDRITSTPPNSPTKRPTMRHRLALLASLAALGFSLAAHADSTYVIVLPITGVTYSYVPGIHGNPGLAYDTLTVTTPPTLSGVDLKNYTEIDFRFTAPAGEALTLTHDAGFSINDRYYNSNADGSTQLNLNYSVVYTGPGTEPQDLSGSGIMEDDGLNFGIAGNLHLFAGDSFTQLDFIFAIPGSIPSNGPVDFSSIGSPEYYFLAQALDPGSYVTFTPLPSAVPEPSSFILLGTGVLSLAGAARRRFLKA